MKELAIELTTAEILEAECVECGHVIYFTTEAEFEKLTTEHAHTRLV